MHVKERRHLRGGALSYARARKLIMIGIGLGFQSMPPLCCEASARDDSSMKSARRPTCAGQNNKQKVIVLMRHGMTDWNFDGRVQGGLDKSRLNKIGVKQASSSWHASEVYTCR